MNGFELWRQLNRAKGPIRKDIEFHLELAIQHMATQRESTFDASYGRMLELEKASRDYKSKVGKKCDSKLLARVLYAMVDDKTSDEMDKPDSGVSVDNYESMREWFETQ